MKPQHILLLLFLLNVIIPGSWCWADNVRATVPAYRIVCALDELPFKEVTDLVYDSDGLLWIATRNGLYCYDGAHLSPYRCDGRNPDRISGNEVKRVVEDQQHRIWLATAQGLDRLDKHSGVIEHMHPEGIDVTKVNEMSVTRNGHVWLATDAAFLDYAPETDTFHAIVPDEVKDNPYSLSGQCILEDHRGFIWLGTWAHGLFRYQPQTGELVKYPRINDRNSAHVLIEDEQKRIWVAGWSCGVHLLENAWDEKHVSWQTFTSPDLIGDITYSMTLDAENHQLLIGSSRGLTVASTEHIGQFTKIADPIDGHPLPGGEITGIEKSRDGLMWVSMIGEGVAAIEPEQQHFCHSVFASSLPHLKHASVRSIYADRNNRLWLGIGTQGPAVKDLATGQIYNWTDIPALAKANATMSTVYAIIETYDGHIWLSTYGGELIDIVPPPAGEDIRQLKSTHYTAGVSPLTPSERIFTLFEDQNDNLWVGGYGGIVVRHPDGSFQRFDSLQVDPKRKMCDLDVRQIDQAADGSIWLAALHAGVYQLVPKGQSWEVSFFNTDNEGISDNEIQNVCIDHLGTIWAGSHYGDLYRYDSTTNRFISVKGQWNLPGASVTFICEHPAASITDDTHRLWVGTNVGLLYIEAAEPLQTAIVRHYTQNEGMLDNHLIRNAITTSRDGRLYFGTYKGYNDFDPTQLVNEPILDIQLKLGQLIIGDTPWQYLPEEERQSITSQSPRYAQKIVLDSKHPDFTMEFIQTQSLRQKESFFSYRLEGYDADWRYTWGAQPRVYYSNLPAGRYTLKIYATKSADQHNEAAADGTDMLQITIEKLPAWYETLWAKCIYWVLGILAVFLIYRGVRSLKHYWIHMLIRARERAAMRKGDIIIKPNKITLTNQDKDFIERAIACIETHLSNPDYDQQRFLDDMGVSKATCFRRLKSLTGQSYTVFVRNIKMKAALRLQKNNPNIRISDLAYAVGFSDPKYFSTCFKKYYGKLPSEFLSDEKNTDKS